MEALCAFFGTQASKAAAVLDSTPGDKIYDRSVGRRIPLTSMQIASAVLGTADWAFDIAVAMQAIRWAGNGGYELTAEEQLTCMEHMQSFGSLDATTGAWL